MSTFQLDTRPDCWDDARDIPFFRLTAQLFPPSFCLGATVLLASYDDEDAPVPASAAPSIDPARAGVESRRSAPARVEHPAAGSAMP